MMKAVFLLFLMITSQQLAAAPHPLTGSSIINKPSNSLAFSQMGFALKSVPDDWVFINTPESDTLTLEIGLADQPLLSFRSEVVSEKTDLERYVRRYLRDYNQYGFEVTGLQSHRKAPVPSVIVDLKQKNKTSRSRQVFFHRDNKLIIATCADQDKKFDQTLATCNRILGSFSWIQL